MKKKNKKTKCSELTGWRCPVCGRGNSPFTSTCPCVGTPITPKPWPEPYPDPVPYEPEPDNPWYPRPTPWFPPKNPNYPGPYWRYDCRFSPFC